MNTKQSNIIIMTAILLIFGSVYFISDTVINHTNGDHVTININPKTQLAALEGAGSGLVGWWTMDGKDTNWATGQVTDKSGNGNTGQMVNMSTSTSPVLGKVGQALKFNLTL